MRVLVIEDDDVIARLIKKGLEQARFEVEVAADGNTGLRLALGGNYSLIILDVMLPGRDGWSICTALRERRSIVPILMLTARDSVEDRVRGLEGGADDYLPKPFDFKELLARVRALLRRDKLHRARVVRVADLELDTVARTVRRAGEELQLTPREYTLLEALVLNEGRVLTRETILERVWLDDETFPTSVNVHVFNLRKKVDSGHARKLIQTVHGVGYRLRATDEEEAGSCGTPSASA